MIIYSQKYYNKYHAIVKHYKELDLKKSKELYTESHHIIPRSLGGTNSKDNLVRIPARVHFLLHWMLYRIYRTPNMAYAWHAMINISGLQQRYTSKSFEYARMQFSSLNTLTKTGTKQSLATKLKISQSNSGEKNGFFGKTHTRAKCAHWSSTRVGANNPMFGKNHTEETKKKLSISQKGKAVHPNTLAAAKKPRTHIVSEETRMKLSILHKGKKQSPEFIAKRVESRRINRLKRMGVIIV